IHLAPQDTKGGESRLVVLTERVKAAQKDLPRGLRDGHVFLNPATGEAWQDIRKMFYQACRKAKLQGLWFHDLRRSFVTNARRRGIPESVVMRMSGHRTRNVFDRYNIVSDEDLKAALLRIEHGQKAELSEFRQENVKVGSRAPKTESPHRLSVDED